MNIDGYGALRSQLAAANQNANAWCKRASELAVMVDEKDHEAMVLAGQLADKQATINFLVKQRDELQALNREHEARVLRDRVEHLENLRDNHNILSKCRETQVARLLNTVTELHASREDQEDRLESMSWEIDKALSEKLFHEMRADRLECLMTGFNNALREMVIDNESTLLEENRNDD